MHIVTCQVHPVFNSKNVSNVRSISFLNFCRQLFSPPVNGPKDPWPRVLSLPGAQGGLLETPPRWQATIYYEIVLSQWEYFHAYCDVPGLPWPAIMLYGTPSYHRWTLYLTLCPNEYQCRSKSWHWHLQLSAPYYQQSMEPYSFKAKSRICRRWLALGSITQFDRFWSTLGIDLVSPDIIYVNVFKPVISLLLRVPGGGGVKNKYQG